MKPSVITEPEEIQESLPFDRGELVYKVADPEECGIITGILLDINDSVTYRVNDRFYFASELTHENRAAKKIPGFKKINYETKASKDMLPQQEGRVKQDNRTA